MEPKIGNRSNWAIAVTSSTRRADITARKGIGPDGWKQLHEPSWCRQLSSLESALNLKLNIEHPIHPVHRPQLFIVIQLHD